MDLLDNRDQQKERGVPFLSWTIFCEFLCRILMLK